MIPFEELAASGIDRVTAERLNYRCTPDGGWEIPYLDPQGQPYTYGDEVPFVRRKLKPGSDPKYLTPKGAGNRPYLSTLPANPISPPTSIATAPFVFARAH